MILDLGTTYDIDEINIWHYWADGRIYQNKKLYVSSDSNNWLEIFSDTENVTPETAAGIRISAYE